MKGRQEAEKENHKDRNRSSLIHVEGRMEQQDAFQQIDLERQGSVAKLKGVWQRSVAKYQVSRVLKV